MMREHVQYTLGGQSSGRTVDIYMTLISKALAAIDDGLDEHVVLLVRPRNIVRITFKKEPPPDPQPDLTQYIFDDVPGIAHLPEESH